MRNTITVTCLFCSGTGVVFGEEKKVNENEFEQTMTNCPTCKGSGLVDVVEDSSNQTNNQANESKTD
jgi:DnaJ-class molecular chaperone